MSICGVSANQVKILSDKKSRNNINRTQIQSKKDKFQPFLRFSSIYIIKKEYFKIAM